MEEKISEILLLFKRTILVIIIGLFLTIFFDVLSCVFGFKDIDLSRENIVLSIVYSVIGSVILSVLIVLPSYVFFLIFAQFFFSKFEKQIKYSYLIMPVITAYLSYLYAGNYFLFNL